MSTHLLKKLATSSGDITRHAGTPGLHRPRRRGWVNAQIFDRDALGPGFNTTGPAVIEEYGSTTLVWPGDHFEIGAVHEIRIQCSQR
jgi:N-methylhydantoinase A/oxoprolinase/acetone carboxylase beta subunit